MTEKVKKVWAEIERELGHCCLHKKAAFYEISGIQPDRLSLAITQPLEKVEAYVKGKGVDRRGNRFIFTMNDVKVEITSYPDAKDLNDLIKKAFCHALSIDCVGMQSNGMIINPYGGLEDIRNKVVRLSTPDATVSEITFNRILHLAVDDGFTVDDTLLKRLEQEQFIQKENYRKRFCEYFATVIRQEGNWNKAAALLGLLGSSISRRRNLIEYTLKQQNERRDSRYKKAYLYFVFVWLKATGKEVAPILRGDEMAGLIDSIGENLFKNFHDVDAFFEMKGKYGKEFAEFLFDIQEVYAVMEKQTYKRPSEQNFDLMYRLMCEDTHWTNGEETVPDNVDLSDDDDLPKKLEGAFDFDKAMNNSYSEENYDEPTEGVSEDSYVYECADEDSDEPTAVVEAIRKKDVCIDDEISEEVDEGGFSPDDISAYENPDRTSPPVNQIQQSKAPEHRPNQSQMIDGVYNHSRGHKSTVLENGGL